MRCAAEQRPRGVGAGWRWGGGGAGLGRPPSTVRGGMSYDGPNPREPLKISPTGRMASISGAKVCVVVLRSQGDAGAQIRKKRGAGAGGSTKARKRDSGQRVTHGGRRGG